MKRLYLVLLILFISSQVWAENWEYHLSKIRTYEVVRGNKKIFFLSEGGIFYFDQNDNSLVTLTKIEGLSGSDFKGIEYSHATNSLVVYYQNSMIDVVAQNGDIFPISDIKRKNITGNKQIYSASCYNDLCYFSCGFGIVVLDLTRMEIRDTFIIGDEGNYEIVYDVAIDQENIYAGTPNGIKFAPLDAANLLDYSYWNRVDHRNVENHNYNMLEFAARRIWAIHKSPLWHGDRILSRHNAETWFYDYPELRVLNSIKSIGDMLVFTGIDDNSDKVVKVYQVNVGPLLSIDQYVFDDQSTTPYGTDTFAIDPRSAILDTEGTLWIADYNYGAVRYRDGVFTIMNPGGPIDNGAFDMTFSNNKLWVASGGRNSSWDNNYSPAVFQSFVYGERKWESFNAFSHPMLKENFDVVEVVPKPGDPNHIFVATWGGGILEFKDGQYIRTYNESNSTLKSIVSGDYFLRIGGMAFDASGNLWVSNSEVENVLHMMKPDGTWKAFSIPELAYSYKIGKVLVAKNGLIWLMVPRDKTSGLLVMSSDGRQKKMLNVTSYFTNGDDELFTTMNNVFDIVEDHNGKIWVATSKGVAVYDYPDKVFTEDPFYSAQPNLDENDGFFHPLLQNQTVTAIAVDGGNRKYFGTRSSGVFLISDDGTEEIAHYTTENKPLISDGIISLEYDGKNGILYIGTDRGLVSVHTESKEAYDRFTNVYAYPNPVRSNYDGDIYITGLMEDTNVKITTVSGRLVYETTSVGGQAAWNGHDLAGNRVHTGVYLVMCASSDGQEAAVTKILFIKPNR
ncbi:MAG: T9SS type A sorting domain-containing protein [Prolixibacteraceae bacterium]|nr:T9SS type A sorting domain-containing protein [Prolixibacteraceae bacterium]